MPKNMKGVEYDMRPYKTPAGRIVITKDGDKAEFWRAPNGKISFQKLVDYHIPMYILLDMIQQFCIIEKLDLPVKNSHWKEEIDDS